MACPLDQVHDAAPARVSRPFEDALTGLPNRAALNSASQQGSGDRAVMLIDLDQFRSVNDTYGQLTGDAVLCAVAGRLQARLDSRHFLVRLGDDEFAVVLGDVGRVEAEALAHSLVEAIRKPIQFPGGTLFIDAGVGVALPHGELTLWDLLTRAGAAIRRLKRTGRLPRVVVFDESVHGDVIDRSALSLDLRGAVARGELVLDYQPIVDMATRAAVGFEALVRWAHPSRGLIRPLRFIPLAEASGLMPDLGEWVLAQACREAHSWAQRSDQPPYLSVNISIRQLEDPDFISRLQHTLTESGLAPERLKIEVTESVIADGVDAIAPLLAQLRAMGVGVLLDDFGTGYSSLGYVRELPLDGVKLDRVFSRDLTISAAALTLARSIVALLSQLGLEIIAEGLETAAHLAQLRSLGCQLGQGFYFAEPGPPETLGFGRLGTHGSEQLGTHGPEQLGTHDTGRLGTHDTGRLGPHGSGR